MNRLERIIRILQRIESDDGWTNNECWDAWYKRYMDSFRLLYSKPEHIWAVLEKISKELNVKIEDIG